MSNQAVKFRNFTKEDFTYSWDSIPFTFKAGQEIYLEEYKARHFAKHLVDLELNRLGKPTNNAAERDRLTRLCFVDEAPISTMEAMQIEEKNKALESKEAPISTETEPPKRKAGRPKKVELPPPDEFSASEASN